MLEYLKNCLLLPVLNLFYTVINSINQLNIKVFNIC